MDLRKGSNHNEAMYTYWSYSLRLVIFNKFNTASEKCTLFVGVFLRQRNLGQRPTLNVRSISHFKQDGNPGMFPLYVTREALRKAPCGNLKSRKAAHRYLFVSERCREKNHH